MIEKGSGELIGQCGLTYQEFNGQQVPEIGYLLRAEYWHKGYATEAAIACKEYAFNILNFDKVYSIIRDTNIPSQKVALRNDMRIRTQGAVTRSPHFECGPFDHSGIFPCG